MQRDGTVREVAWSAEEQGTYHHDTSDDNVNVTLSVMTVSVKNKAHTTPAMTQCQRESISDDGFSEALPEKTVFETGVMPF
jgi:hypothetical protein